MARHFGLTHFHLSPTPRARARGTPLLTAEDAKRLTVVSLVVIALAAAGSLAVMSLVFGPPPIVARLVGLF